MALWKEYQRREHILTETDQSEVALPTSEPPRRVENRSKTGNHLSGPTLRSKEKFKGPATYALPAASRETRRCKVI